MNIIMKYMKLKLQTNKVILIIILLIIYYVSGAYQPSNEVMLRFYAYYKQATEGSCQQPKPAFWEVVKKAKWEAWTRLGNMSRTEAMNNYVEELKKVDCRNYYNFIQCHEVTVI